jgi:predicted RecA/RadA family phage recombinase
MKQTVKLLALVGLAVCAVAVQAAGVDLHALVQHVLSPEAAIGLAGAGAALTTKFSHQGRVIDWVNGTAADVKSGDVVKMNNVLGVALVDIAIGATGSVGFGIFHDIPKVVGAAIKQGESLTWDVSVGKFDDNAAVAASGDVTGAAAYAAAAPADADATMTVAFTGVPGTVTP